MLESSSEDEMVKPTYKITDGARGKSDRGAWDQKQSEVNV
jgi:hypothetical protein